MTHACLSSHNCHMRYEVHFWYVTSPLKYKFTNQNSRFSGDVAGSTGASKKHVHVFPVPQQDKIANFPSEIYRNILYSPATTLQLKKCPLTCCCGPECSCYSLSKRPRSCCGISTLWLCSFEG